MTSRLFEVTFSVPGNFNFKHIKFKVTSRYPGGDVVDSWKQESGVNRAAWAEDVSLGVIGIWMVFKAMSLHEFLKCMSVDTEERVAKD